MIIKEIVICFIVICFSCKKLSVINKHSVTRPPVLCPLSQTADSNMAGEDGFDEKGCHCEISVEDLLPSIKCVIRAVRWGENHWDFSFYFSSISHNTTLYFSTAKVACKHTLIATLCLPAALLIEHAQGIKVTRRFFCKVIFRSFWVCVIGRSVERQERWLAGELL